MAIDQTTSPAAVDAHEESHRHGVIGMVLDVACAFAGRSSS